MTELTFLGRTGRWGDFHFVYSHGIVVRPIHEVYNRFPDVGQPVELTQCRMFDAINSPWMILALGTVITKEMLYLLPSLIDSVEGGM